jgi:hypothetical protein
MRFTASFDTAADARAAATALLAEGFTVQGVRRIGSHRWVLRGGRLVSTEEELEEAEDRLAECVLDHNGGCGSTHDLTGPG